MKILLNDEYQEVGFWSFLKCSLLTQLGLLGIIYGILFLIGVMVGIGEY